MFNRVLNRKDLEIFKEKITENDYSTKFPHIDLWGKDDAILKWLSVLDEVKSLGKKKLKIVDRTTCTSFVKDKFNVKVIVDEFWFENNEDEKEMMKVVVKIFNNKSLIKNKLFWTGYDKWKGMKIGRAHV